jgi:hypothetical protein
VDSYALLIRVLGEKVVNMLATNFGTPLFLAWEGWLVDLLARAAVVANPAADAYSLGLMLACLAFNCDLTEGVGSKEELKVELKGESGEESKEDMKKDSKEKFSHLPVRAESHLVRASTN